MFATKDAHRYKNTMLRKSVLVGFAGTVTRPVFLGLQMKQPHLDFPTRVNVNTIFFTCIFLFIRSELYTCRNVTFIVSVVSIETF